MDEKDGKAYSYYKNLMDKRDSINQALLEEFRLILKEQYGLEPSEAEASQMAANILQYYRTLERLANHLP